MFNFYLDNTLVEDPLNWKDFEETIERDNVIKGLLPKYDVKLMFGTDGYDYIRSQYTTYGFCKLIELRVDYKCEECEQYETQLRGYIFLSDVKFHLKDCTVECSVEDNNFGARIYNNKTIKTFLNTGKSKNGDTITSATERDAILFRTVDGASLATPRQVIFLYDAFRFLIDFMTDGLVGFESTYLDYSLSGADEPVRYITIAKGKELRVPGQTETAFISFQDLFQEVDKKYPIGFTIIQGSDGRPTVKIENADYFYGSAGTITINNIADLRQSFSNELLYSSVTFGGTTATYDAAIHSLQPIKFLTFKEEEYHLQGECNIDRKLDLKGNYIVDSNIIQELVETNTTNDQYDDETFFVEVDYLGAIEAIRTNNPTTGTIPVYYNANLTNDSVASRYDLAGNIALYLGDNNVGFRASKTADTATFAFQADCAALVEPAEQSASTGFITFPDETTAPNYDAAGNWSSDRYTSTQDGSYQFEVGVKVLTELAGGVDPLGCTSLPVNMNRQFRIRVILDKYDAGGTLIEQSGIYYPSSSGYYTAPGVYALTHSHVFYLEAGANARAQVTVISKPYNYLLDSGMHSQILQDIDLTYIKTIATVTGGGIYKVADSNSYFVSKFEFEKPFSYSEYKDLKLDYSQSLTFNTGKADNRTGWIRKVKRNFATSATDFELISNINSGQ